MNEDLENQEESLKYEVDSSDIPPSDIVAFNELGSCADLVRLFETGQLDIQPDFQREIVWNVPAQTRFIDSLMKQLPIPSMCISLDYNTNKRMVIDGLQRMKTIINFLSDDEYKLSNIDDVDERIAGKTVHTIKKQSKDIYERVQNVTIPITIIRCDTSKKTHGEYLFTIFHRLNSGGAKLNNQEIRNCIYSGSLNAELKNLTNTPDWKYLINYNENKVYRFANEELILRVIAFSDNLTAYNGRLSKFLNGYMFEKRNPSEEFIQQKSSMILRSVRLINEKITERAKILELNKSTLEGLIYGVAMNIDSLETLENNQFINDRFKLFLDLPEFSVDSLKENLSGKDKVINRLNKVKECFTV